MSKVIKLLSKVIKLLHGTRVMLDPCGFVTGKGVNSAHQPYQERVASPTGSESTSQPWGLGALSFKLFF